MQSILSGKDLIRNGTFRQDKTAWATNPIGTHVGGNYGREGPGMQIWPEFSNSYGYIFQELHLPTRTTAASLSFGYRFVPGSGASLGFFRARLATAKDTLVTPLEVTLYPGEAWQAVDVALSPRGLTALNAARAAGQQVYLLLELYAQFLNVNVDNVGFAVDGQMDRPTLSGSIACVGLDGNGYPRSVDRLDPDGSRRQTLWTHPSPFPVTNTIADVAWKPDGSELAFVSNHESPYSAFHSDVYGIRPDGSGLRRITNPPSRAELDTLGGTGSGSYRTGTVTGRIYNNYGLVTTFSVYVEGAREVVAVDVGEYGDESGFTVPDVADLGLGLHYVVFLWSTQDCANGKEYTAAVVDVDPGGMVDAGTLTFNGTCGKYYCQSLSWRRDGSQIGVHVVNARVFRAAGQAIGTELFDAPALVSELAWSPVDDRILYRCQTFDAATRGIYLTTAGGDAGVPLAPDEGAIWVTPAWLPDGSGFVYTLDHRLLHYDLSNGQITPLAEFHNELVANPSPSPDGKCVVFERRTTGTPTQRDLWIVNRHNPVEIWSLTDDGRSSNPDWSRVTAV